MAQEFGDFQDLVITGQRIWQLYRKRIVAGAILLLALWASSSMFYKVEAGNNGVVLRLGKFRQTTNPGLRFKLPWPIDKVYKVPVETVQSLEFGYQTLEAARRTTYAGRTAEHESMARMLTADLNLAHVEWVVQFRVPEPKHYLFNIGGEFQYTSPEQNAWELISDVSEAVMRQVIGDVSVDSVITIGREQIAADAKEEMQRMLDEFESGIKVVAVKLQSATPPEKVKGAFNAVDKAKQSKERIVHEAKGERNRKIPAARGQRDRAIAEAEGYAVRIVKEAQGQASAFLAQLAEYDKAPEITRLRLYLETMEAVLMQVDDKIVIDESLTGLLPLLHLDAGGDDSRAGGRVKRTTKGGGS